MGDTPNGCRGPAPEGLLARRDAHGFAAMSTHHAAPTRLAARQGRVSTNWNTRKASGGCWVVAARLQESSSGGFKFKMSSVMLRAPEAQPAAYTTAEGAAAALGAVAVAAAA